MIGFFFTSPSTKCFVLHTACSRLSHSVDKRNYMWMKIGGCQGNRSVALSPFWIFSYAVHFRCDIWSRKLGINNFYLKKKNIDNVFIKRNNICKSNSLLKFPLSNSVSGVVVVCLSFTFHRVQESYKHLVKFSTSDFLDFASSIIQN